MQNTERLVDVMAWTERPRGHYESDHVDMCGQKGNHSVILDGKETVRHSSKKQNVKGGG